jgi:hypothetical protein
VGCEAAGLCCGEEEFGPDVGVAACVVAGGCFWGAAVAVAEGGATGVDGGRGADSVGGDEGLGDTVLFCGAVDGRLVFRFRTPLARLRIPPGIEGMIFCGGFEGVSPIDCSGA